MKRCTKCRRSRASEDFPIDRSRRDGRGYVCRDCRLARVKPGPSDLERRRMAMLNAGWCSGCSLWLPLSGLQRGKCQPCRNADYRQRYASSEAFREARKANVRRRKRGVEIVPLLARETLMQDFDGECGYCPCPATTWDHIVPVAAGGKTEQWNIVPACQSCNSSKRDREVVEWAIATGRTIKDEVFDRMLLEHCPVA